MSNYKIIDMDKFYRKGVFEHFAQFKCSISMTARINVQALYDFSNKTKTKFYINFLYLISKTLNSRQDYRMSWLYQTKQLIVYDKINPTQYIFHEDTETCTPVYTDYNSDYNTFYQNALKDIERGKKDHRYGIDTANHPNWFDASYVSWLSYDSLNVELPDGHLFFMPIINWGRYRQENGTLVMPVTVRLNHAAADGYLLSKVFKILEDEIKQFCK